MFGKKEERSDLEIFMIYDSKAQSYERPHFEINSQVVMRDIIAMFKDPQQKANKLLTNAEDFSVFKAGSFDKRTGKVTAHNLEHVCNLHDLRSIAFPVGAPEPGVGQVTPLQLNS